VTKTSAKSPAAAKNKAAHKAAAPAKKAAAKTTARPSPPKSAAAKGKPAPKPVAKSHAKQPAKAAAKPKTKPAAKAPSKPAPKSAPKPTTKLTASSAPKTAAKPAAKPAPKPVPAPAPKAPAAKPVAAAPLPQPAPAPASNRFAERFAPPKPPVRGGLPEPIEAMRSTAKADPKLVNAWKSKAGRDLTEPELLAMPEAEYMNEKQLDFFRTRLQALKDDLLSNAGETTEHLREDTSIVPDPADRATIEEEHALELRTRDRERKLLKKISQSLARIEAGDYGYCDETGEPIGLGRLLARPTATLSLEAQQRREMKQRMFGD
jgi:DnaK suppressor protein